ncbi:hypothetical protein ABZ897_01955 [Nonomuraea sp. NPDC046802]|uniref:hypothetical protein n=1 Tax=Nonomuraea sp. NPDC046802 TaxID=3154919 RepID=UPI0033D148BC
MLRSTIAALAMTGAALLLASGPAVADDDYGRWKVGCGPFTPDVLTTSVPMLGQLTVCQPWFSRWGYPIW